MNPTPVPQGSVGSQVSSNPSVTDWLTAGGTLAYTALTMLLVVFALAAWRTARSTLGAQREASEAAKAAAIAQQRANEQAERDSKARTRPYVYAEIVPGLQGPGRYDMKLSNTGQSAALDLTITLPRTAENLITGALRDLFGRPRTLPPGSSLRVMWRVLDLEAGGHVGMADVAVVVLNYRDAENVAYDEKYELRCDASILWPVPEDGDEAPPDLAGNALAFYLLLQTMVRRLGELGR